MSTSSTSHREPVSQSTCLEKWLSLDSSSSKYPYIDFLTPLALEALSEINVSASLTDHMIHRIKDKLIVTEESAPHLLTDAVFKNSWITQLQTTFRSWPLTSQNELASLLTAYETVQDEEAKEHIVQQFNILSEEKKLDPWAWADKALNDVEEFIAHSEQHYKKILEECESNIKKLEKNKALFEIKNSHIPIKQEFLTNQEKKRIYLIYDQTLGRKRCNRFAAPTTPFLEQQKNQIILEYFVKQGEIDYKIFKNQIKLKAFQTRLEGEEYWVDEIAKCNKNILEFTEKKRPLREEEVGKLAEIDREIREEWSKKNS